MNETEWFCGRGVDDDETRRECHSARRVAATIFLCGVVLALLGLIGGGASSASAAEVPVYVHEGDGTVIKLMPGPCVHQGVKDFVGASTPSVAERFRAIESMWRMRDGTRKAFAGCWIEFSADEVGYEAFGLLFEDGDRYLVPKAEFLAGKGAQGT